MPSKFRPMMTPAMKAKMDEHKPKIDYLVEKTGPMYWPQEITFYPEQLPEIEKWEVGKKYTLTLQVKMVAYEQRKIDKGGNKKDKKEGRFEVVAVKSDSPYSKDQKDMMSKMGVGEANDDNNEE